MRRGTGGNRFMQDDQSKAELLNIISRGIDDLQRHADSTGRLLDLGAITIETRRIPSGKVSVDVTADLASPS